MIRFALCTLLALASRSPSLTPADAPAAWLLVERDGELALERCELGESAERTLESSSASGVIDVVLPVALGRSASVESLAKPRELVLRARDGGLGAKTRAPGLGEFERPARPFAELADCDVYVCATRGDGKRAAFLLRGYAHVDALPDGPFLDLFGGKVPLGPHDYAVTTDTAAHEHGAFAAGRCKLDLERWIFVEAELAPDRRGVFALDLGAGTTLLARRALPANTRIDASAITQYQGGQRTDLRYEAGGATGELSGLAGRATLAQLALGSARFRDVEVDVIETLPKFGGREVDGILGLDVLRRARRITISFERKELALGEVVLTDSRGSTRCLALASHLFVPATLGGSAWQLIVDTGAPVTILDRQVVEARGLALAGPATRAGGLDGARRDFERVVDCSFALGGRAQPKLGPETADLSVFAPLRSPGQAIGLLGNDALARLGTVEFDLDAGLMRW